MNTATVTLDLPATDDPEITPRPSTVVVVRDAATGDVTMTLDVARIARRFPCCEHCRPHVDRCGDDGHPVPCLMRACPVGITTL